MAMTVAQAQAANALARWLADIADQEPALTTRVGLIRAAGLQSALETLLDAAHTRLGAGFDAQDARAIVERLYRAREVTPGASETPPGAGERAELPGQTTIYDWLPDEPATGTTPSTSSADQVAAADAAAGAGES